MHEPPYLSIVVAGRNDNYGEDFIPRFQIFLENQIVLWSRHETPAELIIVEWNPPQGNPRLKDALKPPRAGRLPVRIIEVPHALHAKFAGSSGRNFFEYLGKNVGVRRARGEFVLATNTDLIYPPSLVELFASRALKANAFYRVDRYDVARGTVPRGADPETQVRACEANYTCIHNNYGAAYLRDERRISFRALRRLTTYARNTLRYAPYPPPYMNAAGDFFLMSRASWHALRGYPELPPWSYPDALCFTALSSGLRQTVLEYPNVIYHQEHERSAGDVGRPRSDFLKNKEDYFAMLKRRTPWIPNDTAWGLHAETLPEYQFQ